MSSGRRSARWRPPARSISRPAPGSWSPTGSRPCSPGRGPATGSRSGSRSGPPAERRWPSSGAGRRAGSSSRQPPRPAWCSSSRATWASGAGPTTTFGRDTRAGSFSAAFGGDTDFDPPPFFGVLPGGAPGAPDAYAFGGSWVTPDPDPEVMATATRMALLPGLEPMGRVGADGAWMALLEQLRPGRVLRVPHRASRARHASGARNRPARPGVERLRLRAGDRARSPVSDLVRCRAGSRALRAASSWATRRWTPRSTPRRAARCAGGRVAVAAPRWCCPTGPSRIRLLEAAGSSAPDGSGTTASIAVLTPAGHAYSDTWRISVYRQPPDLGIRDDPALIDFSPTLSGETLPGSTLTVNGAPVPVAEDGSFAVPVEVGILPTELRLVVVDPVGNRTERVVTRVWPFDYRQLPFVPIAVLLTIAAGALLFLRKPDAGLRPPDAGRRVHVRGDRRLGFRRMPQVRPLRGLGYALDRFGGTEIPARVRRPWRGLPASGADCRPDRSGQPAVRRDQRQPAGVAAGPPPEERRAAGAERRGRARTVPRPRPWPRGARTAPWACDLGRPSTHTDTPRPNPPRPTAPPTHRRLHRTGRGARHPGPDSPRAMGPGDSTPRAHHARAEGRSAGPAPGDPHPAQPDPGPVQRPVGSVWRDGGPPRLRGVAGARRGWAAPSCGGHRRGRRAGRLSLPPEDRGGRRPPSVRDRAGVPGGGARAADGRSGASPGRWPRTG